MGRIHHALRAAAGFSPAGGVINPDWANVSSLLHFDGADGSTTITDETGNQVWTAYGNAQLDTAESKFGTASLLLDGNGDRVETTYTASLFDWWVEPYTIECWVMASSWAGWSYNPGSGENPALIGNAVNSSSSNYWSFGPGSDGNLHWYYYNGSPTRVPGTVAIPTDQHVHIAMTHDSGTIRTFVDGVLDVETAVSGTPLSSESTPFVLGEINSTSINGHVDELRITKGEALYTSSFTPPTEPFPNG